jgi:O-antigen/teichoic acid export membrane protein
LSTLRRNSLSNLLGRVATAILWIGTTPFVLGHLGPERFGIWSLFFAFNAYLLSFDLGTGNTMLRFIAAQRAANDRRALMATLRWGIQCAVAMGLLWMLAIEIGRGPIATAFHVPAEMRGEALRALTVFGLGVLGLFTAQTLTSALRGFERIDLANLCAFLGVLVHVGLLCAALWAGAGLIGAAWAAVAGHVVSSALATYYLWRELEKAAPGTGPGPAWRDMLGFSAALQVLAMLGMLHTQASRTLLGLLGNLSAVADFELATRVAYAIFGIPILIRDPVIPVVSRIWRGEEHEEIVSLFRRTSRTVFVSSTIALGLLWLLASDIARLWLGPGHERIADLMRLWVFGYAINLAYAPGVAIARGMGLPRFEIWSYAAALIANVVLAFWLIPRDGVAGAVHACVWSFAAGFVVFVVGFHLRSSIFPFWPWLTRELAPRALAGVGATLVTAWLTSGPLAALLPQPGWTHAIVTSLLFVAFFALAFLPLRDTQHLARTVWQMSRASRVLRLGSPSA